MLGTLKNAAAPKDSSALTVTAHATDANHHSSIQFSKAVP